MILHSLAINAKGWCVLSPDLPGPPVDLGPGRTEIYGILWIATMAHMFQVRLRSWYLFWSWIGFWTLMNRGHRVESSAWVGWSSAWMFLGFSWFFSMVGQWGESQFLKPWLHIPVFIPVNGVTNQLVNALTSSWNSASQSLASNMYWIESTNAS